MIFAKERSLPLAYQLGCNLQVFGCWQGSKIRCSLLRKDRWIWSCVKTTPLLFRLKKAVEPQLMGRNGDGKKPQDSVFGVVWLRPWASVIRQTSHLRLFDTVSYVILWSWRCFSIAFQALKKITNSMSVIHNAKGSSINTEAKHFLSKRTNNPSWTPPNGVRSAIYWTRGTYRQDNSHWKLSISKNEINTSNKWLPILAFKRVPKKETVLRRLIIPVRCICISYLCLIPQ